MNYQQTDKPVFKRWTPEEETLLLKEIKDGITKDIIAKNHGRSVKAINYRLLDIAIKLQRSGYSNADIIIKTGMTESDINKRLSEIATEKDTMNTNNTNQSFGFSDKFQKYEDMFNVLMSKIDKIEALLTK